MEAEDNIYAPPKAVLYPTLPPATTGPTLYVVAPWKFFLLYIASFGVYQLYWFYKNWKLYKNYSGDDIWPFLRLFFLIFFVHSWFRKLNERLAEQSIEYKWAPGPTATLYVGLLIVGNFADSATSQLGVGSWIEILVLALVPLTALVLYQAAKVANLVSGDLDGTTNNRLTIGNFVLLALGGLAWLAILLDFLASLGLVPAEWVQ